MKTVRLLFLILAIGATTAFAADPTGTWKWTTHSQAGDIETSVKLESKNGKVTGAYSNQFGDTAISNATLQGDEIAFDVVRNLGGKQYVVHYHGKIEGDTIKGTLEAPGHDGGQGLNLPWVARRHPDKG